MDGSDVDVEQLIRELASRRLDVREIERRIHAHGDAEGSEPGRLYLDRADVLHEAEQIAAKPAGDEVQPGRYQQSSEDYQRAVDAFKRRQYHDLRSGRVQPSTVRSIGVDRETGAWTHHVRRHGGEWSAPEVVTDQMIQANPPSPETERLARAALTALHRAWRQDQRARMRVVGTALSLSRSRRPGGRSEHRPGHRATPTSRGPPDDGDCDPDGDGDVLAPGVARAFSRARGGTPRARAPPLLFWQSQTAAARMGSRAAAPIREEEPR
jgi:hypothetical protein